ncbi:MAG: hypothetical protein NW201_08500 [Gemmatimonadales bacterium]|nr:hypothetical protein [Gemmatimonadales bacterium]
MPDGPPQNAGYMIAAYAIIGVVMGGYALRLILRVGRAVGRGTGA